ncbi:MAG: UPF0175 family protein [Candidatus Auribacterota bacterium]|nr:UPF0175 family protein [Candidatus Auribacterota bacterium]
MTVQVTLDFPESTFSILKSSPKSFANEMKQAAIVKWYEMGLISQSKASEIVEMNRHEFLELLDHFQVSPFQVSREELKEEMEDEAKMGSK